MEALNSPVEDIEWITVEEDSASGKVRRVAMRLAERLGFSTNRAGEIGIAATELATNVFRHAGEGAVLVRVRHAIREAAVELVVVDGGPGMSDMTMSAVDGESTGGTLGIGLGAVTRLATWFDSHSVPGRGTVVVGTFWEKNAPVARPNVAALTRSMRGESVCGDAWVQWTNDESTTILLADGLGHGELAAAASRAAVRAFLSQVENQQPAEVIRQVHAALHGTRGAAVAVARMNRATATLTFCGVGNIDAWIDTGERRHALTSLPGIVGANLRKVREFEEPLPKDALVLLHSDGLTSKWDLDAYPGLRRRDLHLVAATLIRDAGIRHDDASVVVARAA